MLIKSKNLLIILACLFGLAFSATPIAKVADIDPSNKALITFGLGGMFQMSLWCKGDFNGDEIEDVVFANSAYQGEVNLYIILGSHQKLTDAELASLVSQERVVKIASWWWNYDRISSLINAGDINGDGIDDFAIGFADANLNGFSKNGAAFIIYGAETFQSFNLADMTQAQGFRIVGVQNDQYVGYAIGAGDFNGDGKSDLAFFGGSSPAVILFGGSTWPSQLDPSIDYASTGKGFKVIPRGIFDIIYTLSSGVDMNGDGKDDLTVGENYQASTCVYVIYGASTFPSDINLFSFTSSQGFRMYFFGTGFLKLVKDVTGDGIADLVIQVENDIAVIYGSRTGLEDFHLSEIPGPRGYRITLDADFHCYFFEAGDINKDGINDLLIANPGSFRKNRRGYVYGIYGSSGQKTTVDALNLGANQGFRLAEPHGEGLYQYFEAGIAADINGDGNMDYFVGATNSLRDQATWNVEAFYVIYGELEPVIITCEAPLFLNADESECLSPCGANQYLKEGECSADCNPPWVRTVKNGINFCSKPCTGTEVLNTDTNTCQATCPDPWVSSTSDGISLCSKPCIDDALFWNADSQRCLITCLPLWKTGALAGVKTCDKPCGANQVWNTATSTCQSGCNAPWIQEEVDEIETCKKPCPGNQYWNENELKCQSACYSPWRTSTVNGVSVCSRPCDEDKFWVEADQTCLDDCQVPLHCGVTNGVQTCSKPCSQDLFWSTETKGCVSACPSPWISSIINLINTCSKPCADDQFFESPGACLNNCLAPWIFGTQNGIDTCSKPCPDGEYWSKTENRCTTSCNSPNPVHEENGIDVCGLPCASGEFWRREDNTCYSQCPTPWIEGSYQSIQTCEKPCSVGESYNTETNQCVLTCPLGSLSIQEDLVAICKTPCTGDNYWIAEQARCVSSCPANWVAVSPNNVKVCKKPCSHGNLWWKDYNHCVKYCPYPLVPTVSNDVDVCKKPCAASQVWNSVSKTCVEECPPTLKSEVISGAAICQRPCDNKKQFWWREINFCEDSCPNGWKANIVGGVRICDKICAENNLWIPSSNQCVLHCPIDWIQSTQNQAAICKKPCPYGDFWIQNVQTCVPFCPTLWVAAEANGIAVCHKPCAGSDVWWKQGSTCLSSCPAGSVQVSENSIATCKCSTC